MHISCPESSFETSFSFFKYPVFLLPINLLATGANLLMPFSNANVSPCIRLHVLL